MKTVFLNDLMTNDFLTNNIFCWRWSGCQPLILHLKLFSAERKNISCRESYFLMIGDMGLVNLWGMRTSYQNFPCSPK